MTGEYNTGNLCAYCTIPANQTVCSVARELGLTLKQIQQANPRVDLNRIQAGTRIKLPQGVSAKQETEIFPTQIESSDLPLQFTNPNVSSPYGMTLAQFLRNLPQEVKQLKPFAKKREGKVTSPYMAPEGKVTIGHGHLLVSKPAFLIAIESLNLTPKEKDIRLEQALKNPKNRLALKNSLQHDLAAAMQITGITGVPVAINDNLVLSNEQIEVIFCADAYKAQQAMIDQISSEVLAQRTTKQKLVLLDMYFNIGENLKSIAPKFLKYFKAGEIEKAQSELDIFTSNNKILLGLLRRCYMRMLYLNNNRLTKDSERKLFNGCNKYLREHKKKPVRSFKEAEKILRKA